YNYMSKNLSNYPRPLHDIDPALVYNSDYMTTNSSNKSNASTQNTAYNTTLSDENANRFRASTSFYENRSATSRNLITPERRYRSLSQMSLDDISDSHSLTGYDLMSNQSQESFVTQQNSNKEHVSRPNTSFQRTSSLPATSCDTPTWNSSNNPQNYYCQPREKISSIDMQLQRASRSPTNSYNTTANIDSQALNFSDEESLVNWLCTRPDLIAQVQRLSTTSLLHKSEVNTSEPFDKETIINL
ncbi:16240_t:CDS:2, partial [Racocetra persica]